MLGPASTCLVSHHRGSRICTPCATMTRNVKPLTMEYDDDAVIDGSRPRQPSSTISVLRSLPPARSSSNVTGEPTFCHVG